MTSDPNDTKCLNCGRKAGPHYCPHCGQEVDLRRGPLLQVAREVLSDWLSLDSRLLRSLRALAVPGRSTELYDAGKRAPYLRPFRLYLLTSLLLFSTTLALEAPDASTYRLSIANQQVGTVSDTVTRELDLLNTPILLEVAGDRIDRLLRMPRQEILDLLYAGWRRTLPLALILFVPFLALALKLIYIRGRSKHSRYLDHLVFALHFQSALFLAITLAWLVSQLAGHDFSISVVAYVAAPMFMILIYLPVALRRFYGQSWLWTAIKSVAILFMYRWLLGLAIELAALGAVWDV